MDGYVASHMAKQDKPIVVMKLKHKITMSNPHIITLNTNNTSTENKVDLLQVTPINSTIVNIHFLSATTLHCNETWAETNLTYKLKRQY